MSVAVGSPEAQSAIARVRAQMLAEEEAKAKLPEPGKSEWPRSSTHVAMKQRSLEKKRALHPPPTEGPARFKERCREWWQHEIEDQGEVDIKDHAKRFAQMIQEDPTLLDQFVREYLVPTVRHIGDTTLKASGAIQRSGSKATTIQFLRDQIRQENERVSWLEYDPARKIHVPLKEMTRAQVLEAAMHRRKAADENAEVSRWFMRIVDRMNSEEETVGEALTDDELIRLRGLASNPSPISSPRDQLKRVA